MKKYQLQLHVQCILRSRVINLLIMPLSYLVTKMIKLRSKETFVLTKELLKLL